MLLPVAKVSLCGALLASLAIAQTAPDPPSSAMVSPSSGSIKSASIEPGKPSTTEDSFDTGIVVDPSSLLPELPPVPRRNATLIGGTLERLDRVRDEMTLHVFGGGKMTAFFDPRTRVYRGGKTASLADLRQGERVYLDTILDGTTVFARAIRLSAASAAGQSQGIVLQYRNDELTLRDGLAPSPVPIRLNSSTRFVMDGHAVPASTLTSGSLIAVTFDAQGNGHDLAREINILALPGTRYTFTGRVMHIDLRTGLLVLISSVDHKTYEIYLDSTVTPDNNLQPGANVTVVASFEDSRYISRIITIESQEK
jgi:hypothetical protein